MYLYGCVVSGYIPVFGLIGLFVMITLRLYQVQPGKGKARPFALHLEERQKRELQGQEMLNIPL